ncbi:hypothetical protein SUGI_0837900 [Cryptomeria japonica]|uniref:uncharacterized protein LOC131079442 n=1 Tax=Cryptomeria japonica TaxID=3369 RepID=UPI0024149248|nr:uncharacterized protein LOC131079442 [Cryptomeria japonica]GLJ40589.1 hypothetical protein SUGI_0837900 [Cryptomeria japonica]
MRLQGSCHCGAVKFTCESKNPVPYQLCYCGVCRKTAGGGGYAINLAGEASTLIVSGEENITVYQAAIQNPEDSSAQVSSARRRFCKKCGSALWLDDPQWADLIHPFASAIDTDLPLPPTKTHIMVDFKPSWVQLDESPAATDKKFGRYPEESIADWHSRHGLQF